MARCNPIVTHSLASSARFLPPAVYLADADLKAEHIGEHVCDSAHQVPPRYSDLRSTFSVKAASKLHVSKFEMGALCFSVKSIVRQCR